MKLIPGHRDPAAHVKALLEVRKGFLFGGLVKFILLDDSRNSAANIPLTEVRLLADITRAFTISSLSRLIVRFCFMAVSFPKSFTHFTWCTQIG